MPSFYTHRCNNKTHIRKQMPEQISKHVQYVLVPCKCYPSAIWRQALVYGFYFNIKVTPKHEIKHSFCSGFSHAYQNKFILAMKSRYASNYYSSLTFRFFSLTIASKKKRAEFELVICSNAWILLFTYTRYLLRK